MHKITLNFVLKGGALPSQLPNVTSDSSEESLAAVTNWYIDGVNMMKTV